MASGERFRLCAIAGKAVLRMVASNACIKKAMAAIHGNPAILRDFFSAIDYLSGSSFGAISNA